MEFRICRVCLREKELSKEFFYRRGSGFRWECRICALEDRKRFYPKIKDSRAIYIRQYYEKNKEIILEKNKEYIAKNQEERTDYLRQHYQINRIEIMAKNHARHKIRRKEDPVYRIRTDLSTIVVKQLKRNGGSKKGISVMKYLPYSIQELKDHLEAQFEPWMTWQNHGKYNIRSWKDADINTWTWQLDHIIPQASLPYSSMEDENFKKCWALSNLRPLSAKQNVIDGNRKRIYDTI